MLLAKIKSYFTTCTMCNDVKSELEDVRQRYAQEVQENMAIQDLIAKKDADIRDLKCMIKNLKKQIK